MDMGRARFGPVETATVVSSRRAALAMLLGAGHWLRAAPLPETAGAANSGAPIRLAVSESLVSGVNINDARAAMLIWIKQMERDFQVQIDLDPSVFQPSSEILRRIRTGSADAIALNVVEYRQAAEELDANQVISETPGNVQYVLLVKRERGIRSLGDLRGRRLLILGGTRMCISHQWLSTILDDAHLPQADQLFASIAEDDKATKVVLPVFFGQADACITSKASFDLMCELNPQVAKDLIALATSLPLVVTFYTFRRNYKSPSRDRIAHVYTNVNASVSGKQLATLFQFQSLTTGDVTRLETALAVLDKAEKIRSRTATAAGKGRENGQR